MASEPVVWHWEDLGSGRTAGNTGSDGLGDGDLTVAELIAREIPQNFNDATDIFRAGDTEGDYVPRQVFEFKNVTGAEKKRLVKLLNLRDLREHASVIQNPRTDLDLAGATALADLDDDSVSLPVMLVKEYGTVGLRGNPSARPRTSRWFNALESQGVSFHEHAETQHGGTYGFGKAAFTLGSRVAMVIAYSTFLPTEDDDTSSRLGGYIYQRHHTLGAIDYSGFAKFGATSVTDRARTVPFSGGEADEFAESLGMARTGLEAPYCYGTTFMIIDPVVTPDDLVKAIETFWWPALMANHFDLEVINFEGKSLRPRPRRRDDLRPFLEAWSRLNVGDESNDQYHMTRKFARVAGMQPGRLALVADPETCFDGPTEEERERQSEVALVRQRLMVVRYAPFMRNRPPFVQGVLFTDAEVEDHVAKAEPKEHNYWWLETPKKVKETWPQVRQDIIKALHSKTYSALETFRSGLRIQADEETVRLDRLSRLLGSLMGTRRRSTTTTPPKGVDSLVRLSLPRSISERVVDDAGHLRYRFQIGASMTEAAVATLGAQSNSGTITTSVRIVEDTGRRGKPVGFSYIDAPSGAVVDGVRVTLPLTKDLAYLTVETEALSGPFKIEIDGDVVLNVQAPGGAEAQA